MGMKPWQTNEIYSPVENAETPRISVCFLEVVKHQEGIGFPLW